MGIKDDELEGLSDEEHAALADDDDEAEILGKIAGGDDDEEDDAAVDGADDKSGDGEGTGEEDETPADDGAEASVEASDEFRAELNAERPEGLAERLAALESQSADLLSQFTDGSIDIAEFMAQKETIDAERFKLSLADAQAQWAENQNADTNAQRWEWEQQRFFAQDKEDVYKNPVLLAALNASVKQLGADKSNARRPAAYFLEEADRQVRKLFTIPVLDPNKPPVNRQPDLSKVPKTLAQLPAADITETGDVEFAYLDKLDGMALEVALRKLTPEQEARWLGAAA